MAQKSMSFDNFKKLDKSFLFDQNIAKAVEDVNNNGISAEGIVDIELDKLTSFKNHPFHIDMESEKFNELLASIKEFGVIQPILVRKSGDEYEIISGHCRVEASKMAGKTSIPVKVLDIDDFTATVYMAHSNIYGRDRILISEKAKSYRMCLDEQKKMGINRTDAVKAIGGTEDSRNQVYRYVRLSYLSDELLTYVDSGKLPVQTGLELAFLDNDSQEALNEYIEATSSVPSLDQAKLLRETNKADGTLSYERIISLLVTAPKVKPQNKVSFKSKELADYFDEGTSTEEMTDIIRKLLEKYKSGEFVLDKEDF